MIVLDDERILELGDPAAMVAALASAFRDAGPTPPRMHGELPGEDHAKLLLMPAWDGRKAIGVKVVAVMPLNRERGRPTVDGVYVLMDGETGEPLAVMGAATLTALRTAGVSALAASLLARSQARVLLMVGTGALASHLVRAHLAVRPLERVILWGRSPQKAGALARRLSDLPVAIEVASDLNGVLGAADIISSATLSGAPLIEGRLVAPGAHVDLVGSFSPQMREADTDLFRRGRLVVDTLTGFDESGDLIVPLREGVIGRQVPDLTALLASPQLGRRDEGEITIFKSVGSGVADLAAARLILSRHADPRAEQSRKSAG